MIRNETGLLLFVCALASGCSHQVLIESNPPGADLYVDGTKVGITPFSMTDTVASGNRYEIVLQKQGYQIDQHTLMQDQFAWPKGMASVACGVCTLGVGCLGLIWSWQLEDRYHYTLQELPAQPEVPASQPVDGAKNDPPVLPASRTSSSRAHGSPQAGRPVPGIRKFPQNA